MRERTQEEKFKIRLRQLEDAKKRLGTNDPALYDINDEREKIEEKLQILSKNASAKGSEDIRTQARNEPFGQDLNTLEDKNQKQRATSQILQNEPAKSRGTLSGEQAKASAVPQADASRASLKPKNETPGGRAMNAWRRIRGGNKANTSGETGADAVSAGGAGNAAAQAGKQWANKAAQAAKAWGKKVLLAIKAGGPVVWIICGVGLILVIVLFILGLSYMGTIGKDVSTSGGTAFRVTSPTGNAGAIENFLKLSGDTTIANQTINSALNDIKTDLLEMKNDPDIKTKPAVLSQIDVTLTALTTLQGTKSDESSKNFLTQLSGVYNLIEGNIPVWPTSSGSTKFPVSTPITNFNDERHGNSFLVNENVDNHNVYTKSDEGQDKCDAVDIGVSSGADVFPIFPGSVTEVSPDATGSDASYVVVTSSDRKYTALYAHLLTSTLNKKKGENIAISDQLGKAKSNSIQVEIVYSESGKDDQCLVINHADMIDHAQKNPRHKEWGGYLWDRVIKTFNLK